MNTFGRINWIEYYRAKRMLDKLQEENPCLKCARGPNGANNCTHTLWPDVSTSCWKFTKWVRQIWPVVTGKAANSVCKTEKAAVKK